MKLQRTFQIFYQIENIKNLDSLFNIFFNYKFYHLTDVYGLPDCEDIEGSTYGRPEQRCLCPVREEQMKLQIFGEIFHNYHYLQSFKKCYLLRKYSKNKNNVSVFKYNVSVSKEQRLCVQIQCLCVQRTTSLCPKNNVSVSKEQLLCVQRTTSLCPRTTSLCPKNNVSVSKNNFSVSKEQRLCVQRTTSLCPESNVSVSKEQRLCFQRTTSLCPKNNVSVSKEQRLCVQTFHNLPTGP